MRRTYLLCASGLLLAAAACTGSAAAPAAGRSATIEQLLRIDQAGAPMWSPDGRHVAFQWGLGSERDLWAADATASRPASRGDGTARQLAPLTGRADAVVSPDWQLIAYIAKKHIWVLPLHGGRPVRVTTEEGKYSGLNWAPDSRQIAFVVERNDQDDVGVAPAAGGSVTMIASTARDEDSPIWSPSSDRLAFIRRFDDWTGYEIWVGTPTGTNQHQVARETYQKGVEEFHFDGNDEWSPDGTRLAYLSSRSGYNHVWTLAVDSGEVAELTKGAFVDYDPHWSPAGNQILFISSRAGVSRTATSGRSPRQEAILCVFRPTASARGRRGRAMDSGSHTSARARRSLPS